jgi:hypothetical protein
MAIAPFTAEANEHDEVWNDIDRLGLYNTLEDGQIVRNIWDNYTQEEDLNLLNTLPDTLRSPVFRDVVKRILLSTAKPSKEDINSPALLAKRLSLLIRYGLFNDAQSLYDLAVKKNTLSQDYDLALIGLQLTMLNGDIAPICLDVEAFSEQFRDMPAWRELSTFCQLRFGSNDKINVKATTFKQFPILKNILTLDSIPLQKNKGSFDTLAIYADNKITDDDYNNNGRDASTLNDIALALTIQPRYKSQESYQCYAIEAAKRGIKDTNFLAKIYRDHTFSDELLNNGGGDISLHPCNIPAFFYQKLQQDITDEDKAIMIAAMMDVTKHIPNIALTPMHDKLSNLTVPHHQWRSSFLYSLIGETIPKSYGSIVSPLRILEKENQLNKKDYIEWYTEQNHKDILLQHDIDPASILYISYILNGDLNHLKGKTKKQNYENLFSLTYAKKSLSLGLGFNDYIAKSHSDDNHAATLIKMIAIVGNIQPQEVHLNDIAVILSALKAYKLKKNAIALSFEYLQ